MFEKGESEPEEDLPSSPAALGEPSSSAASVSAPVSRHAQIRPVGELNVSQETSKGGLFSWLKALFTKPDRDVRRSLEDIVTADLQGGAADADLGDDERTMIRNVLQYHEVRVDDVMVPRADIIAIDEQESFESLVAMFIDAAHSRIPVYSDTMDNVIGMVHIKDVVAPLTPAINGSDSSPPSIASLIRSVLYVPPSMRVIDLLARMRAARMHMAVVVDEFGGTDGLVTIEDLVEQIVGEIEDEHDEAQPSFIALLTDGVWLADARLSIEDAEVTLGADLSSQEDDVDVDTLGGLVVSLAGRVPVIGEHVTHPAGLVLEVIDGDPRRIKQVRVSRTDCAAGNTGRA
ncbi:MAG: hemolysin family protein [Pseudomonadota bacterium]